MTQSAINSIILDVKSLKIQVLLLFFLSYSVQSFGFGGLFNRLNRNNTTRGVAQSQPARAAQTHGGVRCTDGQCGDTNSFRRSPVSPVDTGPNLANGVNRAMSTLFRSCSAQNPINSFFTRDSSGRYVGTFNQGARFMSYTSATDPDRQNDTIRTVTDGARLAQNGPYSNDVSNGECSMPQVNGQTVDMRETPALFQYRATMEYLPGQGLSPYRCATNTSSGYCNLGAGSQPAVALDCMEFVGLAFASACIKFTEDDNFRNESFGIAVGGNRELSNRAVYDSLGSPNSCLNEVPQNSTDFLQDGDLFFGSSAPNHATIITDVGPDPLGIRSALSSGKSCDDITPNDFNFSLAQSSSFASVGPIKSTASAYFWLKNSANINNRSGGLSTPFPLDQLLGRAVSMCRTLRANPNATSFPPYFAENHHLVRHNGSPECVMDDDECPDVVGDECADRCEGA